MRLLPVYDSESLSLLIIDFKIRTIYYNDGYSSIHFLTNSVVIEPKWVE